MDKAKVFEKYKKEDERLIISKLFDKISLAEKQNKIQITDFVSPFDLKLMTDVLTMIGYNNYKIYGGLENAQRNVIIIYPDKLEEIFENDLFDYNTVFNCIRIKNKSDDFEHKVYLGGLIKLGVRREKIGDIVVFENGADIIVDKDVSKFLVSNLHELTRFQKSSVEVVQLEDITKKEQEFKELKLTVSSLRLDNVVAELAKTSRNKAVELLNQERVFINYKNELRNTKMVKDGDLVTIRGIGKFIIDEVAGNTRSGKIVLNVRKFV